MSVQRKFFRLSFDLPISMNQRTWGDSSFETRRAYTTEDIYNWNAAQYHGDSATHNELHFLYIYLFCFLDTNQNQTILYYNFYSALNTLFVAGAHTLFAYRR